ELGKGREIQEQAVGLKAREIEQVVFATFLHSQPIGQKVATRDLLVLLGHTRPDRIDLEKGLRQWADASWFLDEAMVADAPSGPGGTRLLPNFWRLGTRPNLRQMHHEASARVLPELIEARLLDE